MNDPVVPVVVDVTAPERFSRAHVLVRIVAILLLSSLGGAIGWPGCVAYLALPVVATLFVSEQGSERYLAEEAPQVARLLGWLVGLYGYLGLLTDRFPGGAQPAVTYEVRPEGQPTVGSAILRILFSLPVVILLWVFSLLSAVLWVVAAIFVLVDERYPEGLGHFQLGVLRMWGQFLAYHASLVDEYPPLVPDFHPRRSRPLPPSPAGPSV